MFGNVESNQITIGNSASPASGILVTFNVTNFNAGADQLTIDDTANTTAPKTITVTATQVTGLGGTISYSGTGLEKLLVKAGGGNDVVTVLSTSAGTTTEIATGAGDDEFRIRNAGALGDILGPLTLEGGRGLGLASGSDRLEISDATETSANTYTFSLDDFNAPTLQRAGGAIITFSHLAVFSLTTGSGDDTVTVDKIQAAQPETTLTLGAGNDKIVWGAGIPPLYPTTIEAGPGTDTFQFNARPSGDDIATLNCSGRLIFGRDCTASAIRLSFGGVEQAIINGSPGLDFIEVATIPGLPLTVNALAGDDRVAVLAAGAGSTVTINAGEGNDRVLVGIGAFASPALPASALAIQAPVTVDGGNGTNQLTIVGNAAFPVGAASVTITPTQVGAGASDAYFGSGGNVTYAGFATLSLTGYDVNDTVRVTPSTITEIAVVGGEQTTGDTLDVNLAGTTRPALDLAVTPNELRFSNRQKVTFTGFETRLANGQPLTGLCTPRPDVKVTVAPIGNNQLRATLQAQTLPATPGNELRTLRIARLANTRLTLNGQQLQESQVVQMPAGSLEAVLVVERLAPGQPATAQLLVTDTCGDWPTLVGGGTAAFR